MFIYSCPVFFPFSPAFHKAFGGAVGVRRPNFWMFIRVLKDRQSVTENTFEAARRGQQAPRRRRKWRVLKAWLTTLKEEYNAGKTIINSPELLPRQACHNVLFAFRATFSPGYSNYMYLPPPPLPSLPKCYYSSVHDLLNEIKCS